MALNQGKPVAVDPNDEKTPIVGDLFANTAIKGIKVKTPLQIISKEVNKKTLKAWSRICGISEPDIEAVVRDLTGHGKRACVDVHRGVSQHTNGFYNVFLAWTINLLLGNYDWKGGMIAASTFSQGGNKPGQPFDVSKMAPGRLAGYPMKKVVSSYRIS